MWTLSVTAVSLLVVTWVSYALLTAQEFVSLAGALAKP
jgi:hypothetical protein